MTRSRSSSRTRRSSRGGRKGGGGGRRDQGGSVAGRLARGILAGFLLLVALAIAASYFGIFGRGDPSSLWGSDAGDSPIYPAVLDEGGGSHAARGGEGRAWRPLRPVAPEARAWTALPPERTRGGEAREGAGESPASPDAQAQETRSEPPTDLPSLTELPPIRVHLANGCGVDRLAARMRERLREAGFDVMGVSNADRDDYRETLVIDRSGQKHKAVAVNNYLQKRWGVGRVLLQSRSAPVAEVLVILGPDLVAALEGQSATP